MNYSNLALVTGKPFLARFGFGLLKPKHKIPGSDIAGRVEAAGRNVKNFLPGDEVFGDLSACGRGGFAEYVCAPENALTLKPINMTFELHNSWGNGAAMRISPVGFAYDRQD